MRARPVSKYVYLTIVYLLLTVPPALTWGQDAEFTERARIELALRSWLYTTGETTWSHNASGIDPLLGDPTSKLKYKDTDTHLVGLGAKVQVNRRLFLDGEFGFSVDMDRGKLIDDDFSVGQGLFSSTSSNITGKSTWYVSGNVGFRALEFENNRGHLDVLAGFQYWRSTYEATGIQLLACDSSLVSCTPPSGILPAIKNTTHWITPFQFGGQLEYHVWPRVTASVKMLFSPASGVLNDDIHFQRSDLAQDPSFRMWGIGVSATVEPTLRIMLTRQLALVGGYRVMWNRTYYGRWEVRGLGTGSETAPLTEFQTIRHGVTVGLTASF